MFLRRTATAVKWWPRCLPSSARSRANHTITLAAIGGVSSRSASSSCAAGAVDSNSGACTGAYTLTISPSRPRPVAAMASTTSTAPTVGGTRPGPVAPATLRHASSSTKTPPPPSVSAASSSLPQPTRSSTIISSSSTSKIPSQRTAQIARHLSSSALHNQPSCSNPSSATMASSEYTVRKVGPANTLEHRVYTERNGVPVSPFHDIPLYANPEQTILNMVVEIPRWSNAKLEISKEELLNPIKQDVKKGKLRFVRNCFPHKGYLWNYGCFPQTWEDPNTVHPETKAKGDNDPLDVCEIGELVGYTGQVKQVKVLGVMALLDEEETDWKVIVIDVTDPLASKLNDVEDVERHLPGLLRATNEWFRIYKIPDGKPENQFAFTGECKNKDYAMDVVRECAEAWERLITGKTAPGDIALVNTTASESPARVSPTQLPQLPPNQDLPPAKIDSSIDKWFFISGASA